jgi:hypothetical protein
VQFLLDAEADVHARDDLALRLASEEGYYKIVKLLLDAGADVHADDDYALRYASVEGHDKVVKLLLDAGADVHADDDQALRYASRNGHDKVVKLLLDAGANVHAKSGKAVQWESQRGHDKVVKMLKAHIAKEKKRKKVKESLNEKFTEDSDPITDMGIGVRQLIENWLKRYGVTNYKINDDLTIDCNLHIHLANKKLTELPDYIQFGKVTECFWIQDNQLTSLRGCPYEVGDWFSCAQNKLKTLKYAPKIVKEKFIAYDNLVQFTKEDVERVCKAGSIMV